MRTPPHTHSNTYTHKRRGDPVAGTRPAQPASPEEATGGLKPSLGRASKATTLASSGPASTEGTVRGGGAALPQRYDAPSPEKSLGRPSLPPPPGATPLNLKRSGLSANMLGKAGKPPPPSYSPVFQKGGKEKTLIPPSSLLEIRNTPPPLKSNNRNNQGWQSASPAAAAAAAGGGNKSERGAMRRLAPGGASTPLLHSEKQQQQRRRRRWRPPSPGALLLSSLSPNGAVESRTPGRVDGGSGQLLSL